MITTPIRMYPPLLCRRENMAYSAIMNKVKARGGSSSPTVTVDNAALLQRCMEYKGYTPTLYQSLARSEISDMVQQGVTTQYELYSFLQDPTHGILANIVDDAKKAYDRKSDNEVNHCPLKRRRTRALANSRQRERDSGCPSSCCSVAVPS